MTPLIRPCALAALLASCLLCGCSRSDPAAIGSSSAQATTTLAPDADSPTGTSTAPTDDPCALLTDAEVSEVFPGAASGKRNHSLDGNGILTCVWDTPTDRFVVQVLAAKSGSIEDELRGRVQGSVDPLMAGAADRVRYETMTGLGDAAMSVVERADPPRGILADTVVLVTQRAERRAVLFTGNSLASGDRASALKALETLGRHVVGRL